MVELYSSAQQGRVRVPHSNGGTTHVARVPIGGRRCALGTLTWPRECGRKRAVTAFRNTFSLKAARATRRPLLVAVLIIAAMTAMRIVYASVLDLRTDEAYYWTWSKELPQLCFLDLLFVFVWFFLFGLVFFGVFFF